MFLLLATFPEFFFSSVYRILFSRHNISGAAQHYYKVTDNVTLFSNHFLSICICNLLFCFACKQFYATNAMNTIASPIMFSASSHTLLLLLLLSLLKLREIGHAMLNNGTCKNARSSRWYSLIVDETSDTSRKEQVSICLRYVNSCFNANEAFVGFFETDSTTSETLFRVIKDVLMRLQLNINDCRGQCYDHVRSFLWTTGLL